MRAYVALLRAVNVGGTTRVPMVDLRAGLTAAGLSRVETYLQSGNVVFDAKSDASREGLAALIRERIRLDFGHDVPVLVLDAAELQAALAENPFAQAASEAPTTVHVAFLSAAVPAARVAELDPPVRDGEELAVAGRVAYLHLPHGSAQTKLNLAYLERALGVGATARNWRTACALAERVSAR